MRQPNVSETEQGSRQKLRQEDVGAQNQHAAANNGVSAGLADIDRTALNSVAVV